MRPRAGMVPWMLVAAGFLLAPGAGSAQVPGGPDASDADRREMVERIEAYFRNRLARELEIPDDDREEFFSVLVEFDSARRELAPRRMRLLRDAQRQLRGEGSDEEARSLIEGYRELRRDELDLQAREEDRLLEIIGPRQVLRLQFLREEFRNEIRRLQDSDEPSGAPPPRRRGLRDWLPGFRR